MIGIIQIIDVMDIRNERGYLIFEGKMP